MSLVITKKDKQVVIFICILLAGIVGFLLFRESPAESECIQEVIYHPGTSNSEAYYSFSFVNETVTDFEVRKFETKDEAIDFCINTK